MPPIWMIVVAVLLLLIVWFVGTYNVLVRLRNKTREAFSTVDVYLQKRYDLIPNIVESVKGYASHEKETLQSVIQARNMGMSAQTDEEKIQAANSMTSALGRLMVVVERYPELQSAPLFQDLTKQLKSVEDELSEYRKYYNAVVLQYNNKIETIPSNIVASLGGFKTATLFTLPDEAARVAPKVQF